MKHATDPLANMLSLLLVMEHNKIILEQGMSEPFEQESQETVLEESLHEMFRVLRVWIRELFIFHSSLNGSLLLFFERRLSKHVVHRLVIVQLGLSSAFVLPRCVRGALELSA